MSAYGEEPEWSVAAIHPCDSEPWCCVGKVSPGLEGATIGCGPTCNQAAVRAEAATRWLLARCMSRMKCQTPGRWETPTISHPAHGALQIPPSPLNHIQSILYFLHFSPLWFITRTACERKGQPCSLFIAILISVMKQLICLISQNPPSPSPKHQREWMMNTQCERSQLAVPLGPH